MTTHPSVVAAASHQQSGGATSKLQLMNLKAAAQNVGLDTGCVGWAILEKLVASESGEWADIWNALWVGKATLLLPLEPAASNDKITADFVRDHVILCDGPSRKNAHIITLSGLRELLTGENTLTLRSTIHPSSKTFMDLLSPVTRSSTLANLAPLPHLPTATPYPMFGVPSYIASLPLPPRTPPPLPPRPSLSRSSGPQSLPSRLPNPFASLFGSHNNSKPPAPQTQQASPPASIHEAGASSETPLDVPAFTLARRIVRKDAARGIDRALHGELQALCGAGAPWVAERVDAFVAPWYPFARVKRSSAGEKGASSNYVVGDPLAGMLPEEIGEMVQGFYARLEEDLRSGGSGGGRRKASEASHHEGEDEKGKDEKEAWVLEVLGNVERAICMLFFDRLFAPPTSDDSSHDQALSSRVAALNMLDLNLEHLGVDVPPRRQRAWSPWLRPVVKVRCVCLPGQLKMTLPLAVLSSLELHQSPAEKAAVMVQAHREVIVNCFRGPLAAPPDPIADRGEERARASSRKIAPPNILPDTPGIVVVAGSGSAKRGPPPPLPLTPPPSVTISDTAVEADSSPAESSPSAPAQDPTDATETPARPELVRLPPSSNGDTPEPVADTPSPPHTHSPPSSIPTPTPVSSDVLLPLIIFAVVKSNPPRLVSHLLFTQRFRVTPSGIAQGEEAFCLVNLMAVAEFLENVDLEALGLGDGGISSADLTPIPLPRNSPKAPAMGLSFVEDGTGLLRRQFLPGTSPLPMTPALDSTQGAAPWNFPHVSRPGFGLLRRETGFSIGGISIGKKGEEKEKKEEELREVSRPGSVRSVRGAGASDEEGEEDGESGEEEEEEYENEGGGSHDTRSIRSFESMLSRERSKTAARARQGLGGRASRTGLHTSPDSLDSRHGSPPPRRESLLSSTSRFDTPVSSRPSSPAVLGSGLRLPPPNPRFLDCAADDLRLAEVAELLRDYRRLVDGVRAVGGFIGDD
ncbi:hypothetical protein B0H13DRAFT_1867405 [Mycena leptocephala]|nr:hypothetical protein B0H13DRAFT_1867405 [Mycena leptocephala]